MLKRLKVYLPLFRFRKRRYYDVALPLLKVFKPNRMEIGSFFADLYRLEVPRSPGHLLELRAQPDITQVSNVQLLLAYDH
jgi:hypothetical protein